MKDKKDKSPAKFIGTLGAIKGVLGGANNVFTNIRAAKKAGENYSFGQGLGDFVQGGVSGIVGAGPTINRAGAPERSVNNLQAINTIQDPGMQSAQQAAAYQKFNNIAQYTPPPTMMKYNSPAKKYTEPSRLIDKSGGIFSGVGDAITETVKDELGELTKKKED